MCTTVNSGVYGGKWYPYVSVCSSFACRFCVCKLDFGNGRLGMLVVVALRGGGCGLPRKCQMYTTANSGVHGG